MDPGCPPRLTTTAVCGEKYRFPKAFRPLVKASFQEKAPCCGAFVDPFTLPAYLSGGCVALNRAA